MRDPNINHLCRLCMSEDGVVWNIFDTSDQSVPLADRIFTCVSLKVEVDDDLPSQICQRCCDHIDTWFEFKERCENTDARLRKCIKRTPGKVQVDTNYESNFDVKLEVVEDNDYRSNSSDNDIDMLSDDTGDPTGMDDFAKDDDSPLSTDKRRRKKVHRCDVCGQMFEHHSFQLHYRSHTGERPYICDTCGKSFKSLGNLTRHKRTHSGKKPFSCRVCERSFTERGSLKEHENIHLNNKRWQNKYYLCKECGKCFAQKGALKTHETLHSGERPFSCSVCGKCFSLRGNLNTHIRTHSGEKPFTCKECGKSFRQDKTLKQHHKVHSDTKPFSCSVCNKSFGYQNSLKIHLNSHTGEKPYLCEVCQKRFTQQCHLKRHLGMVHKTSL